MTFEQINTLQMKYYGAERPFDVGRLALINRKIFFEYSPSFFELGLELSPFKLPLKTGGLVCEDRVFEGLFGGAWVAGNLDTHDNLARYLCRETQAVVVSVEYLNSPEGKFPLPLEQCYDALLWIVEHAQEFHAGSTRLAVVGDSAGGNMSTALCLLARDRKGPSIDLQVLINPATDLTGGGSIQRQDDALDSVRWYATQYVMDPHDANSPYVSPMMAKDLTGLPPAVVILAENDDLRKDGQKYADRLSLRMFIFNGEWGI